MPRPWPFSLVLTCTMGCLLPLPVCPCLCALACVPLQSPVFVKQFAHSILELGVAALFPELKGAILEIRQGAL